MKQNSRAAACACPVAGRLLPTACLAVDFVRWARLRLLEFVRGFKRYVVQNCMVLSLPRRCICQHFMHTIRAK